MIQRIQSIFLFLAAAMGFGVLALPFAKTAETFSSSTLFADAQFDVGDNIGLLVLFAVAGALALASIFLFRNRKLQMTISRIAIIANVIGIVLACILFIQDKIVTVEEASIQDGVGAYLPFGFLVFGILALRAIGKDEKLVKSMDRLR